MLFTSLSRSVLEKTVPGDLRTARPPAWWMTYTYITYHFTSTAWHVFNITFTSLAFVSFFADAFEAIYGLNAGGMMIARIGFAQIFF